MLRQPIRWMRGSKKRKQPVDLMRKHNLEMDGDFLRAGVQLLMQWLIELEASEQIGVCHTR